MSGKESGVVPNNIGEIIKEKLILVAKVCDEKLTPVKFSRKKIDEMQIEKEKTEEYSI